MNILNECTFLKPEGIARLEEKYNAKYVFESCLKNHINGWTDWPAAIFYTEEAHPRGSNYFAIFDNKNGDFMITNGISATRQPFNGLQVGDDIIYSRYRHDYREHNGAMVDGGRDYFRRGGDVGKPVMLRVNKDKLEICNEQDSIS